MIKNHTISGVWEGELSRRLHAKRAEFSPSSMIKVNTKQFLLEFLQRRLIGNAGSSIFSIVYKV